MDTKGLVIFALACSFAAEKHKNQRRKDSAGTPYINHPLEVSQLLCHAKVSNAEVLSAAVLHDTLEDTETTYAELEEHFGAGVAELVKEVTDDKSLPKVERKKLQVVHAATHMSFGATLIKLADKLSNIASLKETPPLSWSPQEIRGYAIWGLTVVKGLRNSSPYLESRLDDAFVQLGVDPKMGDAEREAELQAYYDLLAEKELAVQK